MTGSDPDGYHGAPLEWLAGGKVYLASKSYFEFGAGTGVSGWAGEGRWAISGRRE